VILRAVIASILLTAGIASAETIRIGVSAPMTGIQAPSGLDVSAHLVAAMDQLNSSGAFGLHRGELTVLDDVYDPEKTKSNVIQLIREKKVHLLMSQMGSAHINASLPAIQGSGVTLFAPLAGPSSIYADSLRPSIVTLRGSYVDEVRQQIRLLNSMGVTSVAVVYQDDAFGKDILAAWATHSPATGIALVSQVPVPRGVSAIEPMIDSALAKSPGAVILALVSTPALRAAKYVKLKRENAVFSMLMSVAATSEVIEALKASGKGAVLFSSVMPLPSSGSSHLLLEYADLRKKYKLQPSFRGLEAYVALRIVADQVRKMPTVTPQTLGLALSAAQGFTVSDLVIRTREPRFADVFAITRSGVL